MAAAAATGILVGSAMVATRVVVHQAGPASLALLRYAIGVCCLLPVVLLSARVRFARRDLLPIALLGITQFGILIALLNVGLAHIPSARAALIFATLPLLTLLLSAALGRERLTATKSTGVLLTIVGVGLALGEKALQRGDAAHVWVGELAVFASAVSGAVCSVLYRPYLRKYPTLPVSAFAMLARSRSSRSSPPAKDSSGRRLGSRRAAGWRCSSSASTAASATSSGSGRSTTRRPRR